MITVEEATKKLMAKVRPLETELVPVLKSYGRVLRENIHSPLSIPPFRKSAMDGYAVKAADITAASDKAPVVLKVLEDIPAGQVGRHRLKKGTASRIMTGAPVPDGADTVVMVEDTEVTKGGVCIKKAAPKGLHVAPVGEDVKKGQKVLSAGTVIGPAELGMLASTGRTKVSVGIRPKVCVISTGSEVLTPGKEWKPGHIYDSNGYSLTGLAMKRGGEAKFLGIAPDRKGALERKIDQAGDCDILLLSGGVSVGDYDFVQDILLEMGIKRLFWKVRMKPGKPVFAGIQDQRFILGLPGHPVSCMVTFSLFVGCLLDGMLGKKEIGLRRGQASLVDDVLLKPGRRKFLRGRLQEGEGGRLLVQLFQAQASGILRSMVASNVLVDVPDKTTALKAGAIVNILCLE